MTLQGRTALVIGGGNGLGKAIAKAFKTAGATVAAADLDAAATIRTHEEIGESHFPEGLGVDISDPESSEALIAKVTAAFGKLDIFVNCAAICLVDPLMDLTPERWDKVFAVNTKGAFFSMRAAAKHMMGNGYGRIIQISTPASRMGFPDFATYGASKAALDSIVKASALSWAPHGVTVNSIVPGRMTGGMILDLEKDLAKISGQSNENLEEARTKSLPMRRRVDPSEVAQAAVFLASDAASYVTGERFNFTGGMELN